MLEKDRKVEIKPGARVVINKLLGVSESEAENLAKLFGVQKVREVNSDSLQSWDDVGLEVGSEGTVETVYITGYSDVLFNPTKKIQKPFSYAVPTICLSPK